MRTLLSKKGQVQSIAPAILALVFAAIVLVFGLIMTQELSTTQASTISASTVNESLTVFTTGVNQTLSKAAECGFGNIATTSVVVINGTNATGGTEGIPIIGAANYTAYPDGNIINLTDEAYYEWQVSYPYSWGGEACVAGNKTVVGLGTFADFWEIIVLAIVITVVIGLLLVVFGGRERR